MIVDNVPTKDTYTRLSIGIQHAWTQGGYTFQSYFFPHEQKDGYFIGVGGSVTSASRVSPEILYLWAKQREASLLNIRLKTFMGLWIDDSLRMHIDEVIWIQDKHQAMKMARMWQQKAIYDIADGRVLDVEEEGEEYAA